MRRLVAVLLVVLGVAVAAPPVAAEDGAYAPPVPGPVVDPWRPPSHAYGPGNRGIDLAAARGEPVRAAADGEVVFAGPVGRQVHVVVLHPDGIRTSYSFLAAAHVRRGDQVVRGQVVGVAAGPLHFGARAGDRYLDPTALLAGAPPEVHLVPHHRVPLDEADERRDLVEAIAGVAGGGLRAAATGVAWARDRAADAVSATLVLLETAAVHGWAYVEQQLTELWLTVEVLAHYGLLPVRALEIWRQSRLYRRDQRGCTPAGTPAPPAPARGRVAVLVAGFGSGGAGGAVADVDTAALGYADGDVALFSYRGGQVGGRRAVAGVEVNDYDEVDSTGDLRVAAARLRDLLRAVRARRPGAVVDVIAHSQGGVVARLALGAEGAGLDPRLPRIANLVTLGTPHEGADLATAGALAQTTTAGQVVSALAGIDAAAPAVAQLAETSALIEGLDDLPLPAGTRFTSIAARGDVVVPALHSAEDDAVNVLVPLQGISAHDRLPGSGEAGRELALALAGRRPTCRGGQLGDLALAGGIELAEDALLGGLAAGSLVLDARLPAPSRPHRSPGPVGHG